MNWSATIRAMCLAALAGLAASAPAQLRPKPVVTSPRLYVLDCGTIVSNDPERFGLTRAEVANTNMANMCFLVVHPKGTLLWETGIADRLVGRPLGENALSKEISVIKMNTLLGQLADIGYAPEMIDYLSHSHFHWDHNGNSNAFARTATWLVAKPEWEMMFGAKERPRGYDDYWLLKDSKTVFVNENHDVFGDGSVVITQAFGHTPGHSVLRVRLKNTGNLILAGDLYHYPEEMTLNRMPKREETSGTPQARAKVASLARQTKAQVWISHDYALFRTIRREPAFYD